MSSVRRSSIVVLALILILSLSTAAFAQATSKVTVQDQEIVNDTVTIEKVVAAQDGWLVVHAQASGNPGADLGHAAVKAGDNTNVVVKIDASKATPIVYAMLHVDLGTVGTYEFPGPDVPAEGSQADVNPTFKLTNVAAAQAPAAGTAATAPAALPQTGSGFGTAAAGLLALGVLCLVTGLGLSYRRLAYQRAKR